MCRLWADADMLSFNQVLVILQHSFSIHKRTSSNLQKVHEHIGYAGQEGILRARTCKIPPPLSV